MKPVAEFQLCVKLRHNEYLKALKYALLASVALDLGFVQHACEYHLKVAFSIVLPISRVDY